MPTLLLDKGKCMANIASMAVRARERGLGFRPHCKTHQSAEIASWFRDFGVGSITVSSFRMAHYFALNGWKDILVAFPFNPADLDLLNQLAGSVRISVLLDNIEQPAFFSRIDRVIGFYVDVDTGYGRTGIPSENPEGISDLLREARKNKNLHFKGFYCHAGHSYKTDSQDQRKRIHEKAMSDLEDLKTAFGSLQCRVLYGDTPNCSTMDEFRAVDELTPGNFIFYDLSQYLMGSCSLDQIAVAMACPVCSKYPDGRILVHGGAVHFSKEKVLVSGKECFGRVVSPGVAGWKMMQDNCFPGSLSQEHGILSDCPSLYRKTNVGDQLLILPVHSCLTANLMQEYRTIDGLRIPTMHCAG